MLLLLLDVVSCRKLFWHLIDECINEVILTTTTIIIKLQQLHVWKTLWARYSIHPYIHMYVIWPQRHAGGCYCHAFVCGGASNTNMFVRWYHVVKKRSTCHFEVWRRKRETTMMMTMTLCNGNDCLTLIQNELFIIQSPVAEHHMHSFTTITTTIQIIIITTTTKNPEKETHISIYVYTIKWWYFDFWFWKMRKTPKTVTLSNPVVGMLLVVVLLLLLLMRWNQIICVARQWRSTYQHQRNQHQPNPKLG